VISKRKPKATADAVQVELEPTGDIPALVQSLGQLHADLKRTLEDADRVRIECSKCCNGLNFSCLKFRARAKASVTDAKISIV
jgi:hypothetical protein